MAFDPIFAENAQTYVKKGIFICFKNTYFCLFSWVLEVKLIFQDKFYDIIEYIKCCSSEKDNEKCILRKSCVHQIQPKHNLLSL